MFAVNFNSSFILLLLHPVQRTEGWWRDDRVFVLRVFWSPTPPQCSSLVEICCLISPQNNSSKWSISDLPFLLFVSHTYTHAHTHERIHTPDSLQSIMPTRHKHSPRLLKVFGSDLWDHCVFLSSANDASLSFCPFFRLIEIFSCTCFSQAFGKRVKVMMYLE